MSASQDMYTKLDKIVSDSGEECKTPRGLRRLDPDGPFRGEMTVERLRRLTDDYEMTDVSGDNRISNAPQLPRHPIYSGETSKDRRDFVKSYQDHYHTLLTYETCVKKAFVMPVTACVDAWTKEQIIRFEMKKNPLNVTEQDWITYIREAEESDNVDLAKIDSEMRKLRLDLTLLDAGSRISRLRNQVYRILSQHGLEEEEYVEQMDANRIVKWIVDALESPAFKKNGGKTRNGYS
uniref:Uncharacterized protein AlNc14C245G9545 n=1 Tax=Albugo laibachii Nc14 TaxID=890382 RepID=F0WT61_9STRA|nr:conserved hypothetical protein [Albugo laibachii Nc14]CCA25963.1 conserved hypothetical protein [Albugo laibachii Nc14]|eukprot:CCA25963.1 conserved hypothetical protein [Albugo laibachii Nc14]